jgi:hypothetical protein
MLRSCCFFGIPFACGEKDGMRRDKVFGTRPNNPSTAPSAPLRAKGYFRAGFDRGTHISLVTGPVILELKL